MDYLVCNESSFSSVSLNLRKGIVKNRMRVTQKGQREQYVSNIQRDTLNTKQGNIVRE